MPDHRPERRAALRRDRARRRAQLRAAALMLVLSGLVVGVALYGRGGREATRTPLARTGPRPSRRRLAGFGTTVDQGPAFTPLAFPPAAEGRTLRVPVLMYHRVARLDRYPGTLRDLTVDPEAFAAQLAWLHRAGYHPVRQAQLFRALFLGAPLPRRPLVLTFDDGYVDAVTTVAPLLRRYGWPATFYVITGRLGDRAFLTWAQVRALDGEGMDVGSHTVDHLELPLLSSSERGRQVSLSRRQLESHLGHPVYWFAYPSGAYDATSIESLRGAGYLLAFTTRPGDAISSRTPLAEPRLRVHGVESLGSFEQVVRAGA